VVAGPFGIGQSIRFRSKEPINISKLVAKWVDSKIHAKSSVTLLPCEKHQRVFKADLKPSANTFAVTFECVGCHGSKFKPMHVVLQATNETGRLLKSAPFLLQGNRRKDTMRQISYYEEKADKNMPRAFVLSAPIPATTAPAPTATATTTAMTLIPTQVQVEQTTNQVNPDHRANPPPTTLNQELSAPTEHQGVPNIDDFFQPDFIPPYSPLDLVDFCSSRIDN